MWAYCLSLLSITDLGSLMINTHLGASWEGFALEHPWVIHPGKYTLKINFNVTLASSIKDGILITKA